MSPCQISLPGRTNPMPSWFDFVPGAPAPSAKNHLDTSITHSALHDALTSTCTVGSAASTVSPPSSHPTSMIQHGPKIDPGTQTRRDAFPFNFFEMKRPVKRLFL